MSNYKGQIFDSVTELNMNKVVINVYATYWVQ